MNQRPGITYRKPTGFTLQGLRVWALLFALCGVVGEFVVGRNLLPQYGDAAPMGLEPVAAIMSVLYYCGIPLFSFLLVQGFKHTSSLKNYAIRVGAVAVLAEIPFNLAKLGNPLGSISFSDGFHFDFDAYSLNPIFGVLLCMVVLFFFRYYHGKNVKNIAIRIFVWFIAFLWVGMLRIEDANIMLIIVPVLWLCRRKKAWQVFFGCIATFLTCVFFVGEGGNMTAMVGCCVAPLTFLLIHFYNEEQGEGNRWINYLAYPAMLLAAGVIIKLI